jgi:hypothetical protein
VTTTSHSDGDPDTADNGGWAAHLHYYEARGFDLRKHLPGLRELVERERFDVVILDSYRSPWTGDENDDKENVLTLDPLRQLAHDLKDRHHPHPPRTEGGGGVSRLNRNRCLYRLVRNVGARPR